MQNNFSILNGDTDSITIYKNDFSPFDKDEREVLLKQLNSKFPEGLLWEDDGYYECILILKAKNYILKDFNGKVTYKGSSVKSSSLEPKFKSMLKEMFDILLNEGTINQEKLVATYHKYIKEALAITDIKPWASKRTISDKTIAAKRSNESKVMDAISGTDYREGDKIYVFFKPDDSLCLVENFNGEYCIDTFLKKLYKVTLRLETLMDVKTIFPNYALKRNKIALDVLLLK